MSFTQHKLNKLSWLKGLKIHKNPVSRMGSSQLHEGFGSQLLEGYRGGNPNNTKVKKLFPTFGAEEIPGMEVEQYIKTVNEFLQMSQRCAWDGLTRIETFPDILEDALKSIYETVREDGNDYYDPNHVDAETEEGFEHLLGAIFVEWVDDTAPAQALAERIKGFHWKDQQDNGTVMHPRKFKLRLKQLWKVVDDLPRPGMWPEPTPLEKAQAVWAGLTEDAKLYIKDTKETDPWDIENGGANTLSYEDILDMLVPYWNEKFKAIKEAHEEKIASKKRDRDEDDNEDSGRKGKRQRGNKGNRRNNGNGGGRKNDDEGDRRNGGARHQNNFEKDCTLSTHGDLQKKHPYGQCIFCPSSNNFLPDKAKKFYESGNAPGWWKKTYERRVLKKNSNTQQQQQFHAQDGTVYVAVTQQPTAAASAAAAPTSNGQVAPVFATGSSAPTAAQNSQTTPTYRKMTDANGQVFMVKML